MRQPAPALDPRPPRTNPWPWTALRVTLAVVAHLCAWILAFFALVESVNTSGGGCYGCVEKPGVAAAYGWLFLAAAVTAAPAVYVAVRRRQLAWLATGSPALLIVWIMIRYSGT